MDEDGDLNGNSPHGSYILSSQSLVVGTDWEGHPETQNQGSRFALGMAEVG